MSIRTAQPRLILLAVCVAYCVKAQSPTMGAFTPAGVTAAPAPAGAGFEQYNSFNGSLGAAIPLHHIGGRGEAGFDLVWNLQPGWLAANIGNPENSSVVIEPYPSNNTAGASNAYGLGGPGSVFIRTGINWQQCGESGYGVNSTLTTLVFTTPSGGQITLTATGSNGGTIRAPFYACTASTPGSWDVNRGTSFRSTDNSQLQFNADSNVQEQFSSQGYGVATVSGYLVFPNGVTYRVDNSLVSWIRDRNGNKITLGYGGPSVNIDWYLSVPALTQILDSLGRLTNINYSDSSCGGCVTISYPGAGGTTRQVKVITDQLGNALRSDYQLESINALFPNTGQPGGSNYNPTVAKSIEWPDINTQHTFQYNQYGELAAAMLPAGGMVQYDYGDGFNGSGSGYQLDTNGGGGVMIYRRLQERREYAVGAGTATTTSLTSRQHHRVAPLGSQTQDWIQTFDPSNNSTLVGQTVHTFAGSPLDALSMSATDCNGWNEGLEVQTDVGYPNPLITVVNNYVNQQGCMNNPQLQSRVTTLDDTNQQMQSTFVFDSYGNMLDEKDYDWGQGAPSGTVLREVGMAYLYQNNISYAGSTLNLVHMPYSQTTMDGGGNTIGEDLWYRDEYAPSDDPGIAGHDSNYGTGLTMRGNVTAHWRWLNLGNTFLGKIFKYDIAGNVVNSHNDDNTENTTYGYNDDQQNEYAFPTSVTDALSHKTTASYDYNAGKPASVTDALNNTTRYTYNDGFDRPTTIYQPIGAQTNIFYYTPFYTVINRDHDSTGDGAFQTQEVSDGLGRPLEHRQTVDSQNFIATDVTYDAMGRRNCTVNPTDISEPSFQSADGLNFGTCAKFDSLGRVISVDTPDGNHDTTTYSGNTTTYTDVAGKARKSVTDGLGRVTQVVEDPNGAALVTNYQYDALGNLAAVLKCAAGSGAGQNCSPAQIRNFNHDSLSRLTAAITPEGGRVIYNYGTANTLQSRTDGRASNINTANYGYDATNRLTDITYTDGTPAVHYDFDAAGRLTQAKSGT